MGPATCIDILKLDRAWVLMRLYNAARSQGLARIAAAAKPAPMTLERAEAVLAERRQLIPLSRETYAFDYLDGRVLKVNLGESLLWVALYDRDNGEGAAAAALALGEGD